MAINTHTTNPDRFHNTTRVIAHKTALPLAA
jgi:hypothetical protein